MEAFLQRHLSQKSFALNSAATCHAGLVSESVAYLNSAQAIESLNCDPYWPKWHSPWWVMTLLYEMGLSSEIPDVILQVMLTQLDRHYIHTFPIRAEELPPGVDPNRGVLCHCALGTMVQILRSRGLFPEQKLLWLEDWYFRYQLPDGGYNCDEAVYIKATPHSSFLSTVPMLEAMLGWFQAQPDHRLLEQALARGASYLLQRKLCRSLSKGGAIANKEWLRPVFPRFYNYDVLRGLSWLAKWSSITGNALSLEAVKEPLNYVEQALDVNGCLTPANQWFASSGTLWQETNGTWSRGKKATSFPLLDCVAKSDAASWHLSKEWYSFVELLSELRQRGLLR